MKTPLFRAWSFLALVAMMAIARSAIANDPWLPGDVGFRPINDSERGPTHKVGHWAPLHVVLKGGPLAEPHDLVAASEDSEDHLVRTRTPLPTDVQLPFWTILPTKVGRLSLHPQVAFGRKDSDVGFALQVSPTITAGVGSYLYLCVGGKLEDLPAALVSREQRAIEDGALREFTPTRFAVFENDVDRLPQRSLEYDTADLVILLTGDPRFVDRLKESGRLKPLLQWVRDGGRLVVSLDPKTASTVEAMIHDFESPGKPYKPPTPRSTTVPMLASVESWAGLSDKPFPTPGSPPVSVVRLGSEPRLETLAALKDGSPVIATRPLGFGTLTLLAFPLDGPEFLAWAGRPEFLRRLVDQFGPSYRMPEKTKAIVWRPGALVDDLGTELNLALDNFDVPRLPFVLIAFAILGYLLLAGPIDYLILRRLFGRLEWTWLTYPFIVLTVSGLAYWAYRSTGDRAVLVDRVDLVDVELSTGAMRGTSFFAVRSPDLRALSLELAPNERFLGPGKLEGVALSWFGRPDDGPAGMGRAGTQSFSRKEYAQSPDLARLIDVPFADRGSKTFLATWRGDGTKPRLTANLAYHPRQHQQKITGTITNRYPFDWVDASVFVFDRVHPIEGGIPAKSEITVAILEIDSGIRPAGWRDRPDPDRPETSLGRYDPLTPLRGILFHERLDSQLERKNYLFRSLDWSRRLRDDPRVVNIGIESLGVREAILVARAGFTKSSEQPAAAPTTLLLTPADDAVKEAVIAQDTYLRAIVPLHPQP
jgi:hypothetical protein